MDRRSLLIYFDMRLEEDRDLLQRLRPYITSRRGNEFIKTALREKFQRQGGLRSGAPSPLTGVYEVSEASVPDARRSDEQTSVQAPPMAPETPGGGLMASVEAEPTRKVSETIKAGEGGEPRGASTPEAETPVQTASPRDIKPPRPRRGRLM